MYVSLGRIWKFQAAYCRSSALLVRPLRRKYIDPEGTQSVKVILEHRIIQPYSISLVNLRLRIMSKIVRVGAVQSEPVWLDLDGSVDKTISLIEKAAADGVNVLGFPEVWIPGYPW